MHICVCRWLTGTGGEVKAMNMNTSVYNDPVPQIMYLLAYRFRMPAGRGRTRISYTRPFQKSICRSQKGSLLSAASCEAIPHLAHVITHHLHGSMRLLITWWWI